MGQNSIYYERSGHNDMAGFLYVFRNSSLSILYSLCCVEGSDRNVHYGLLIAGFCAGFKDTLCCVRWVCRIVADFRRGRLQSARVCELPQNDQGI